jgi:hypothetical protein
VEQAQIFWQFKDAELTLSDLDQFIGATEHRWEPGTSLRLKCRRATSGVTKKVNQVNARGRITIIVDEEG